MASTTETRPRPDTWEMVTIHRVFRGELKLLPDLIRNTPEGDLARAAVLVEHLRDLLSGLHDHHTAEDELLWPKLQLRSEIDQTLVDRMEEQHLQIATQIGQVELLREEWSKAAGKDTAPGWRLSSVTSTPL